MSKAIACANCARKVSKNESSRVACICTRVFFCSKSCKETALQSGSHVCPGVPETNADIEQMFRSSMGLTEINDPEFLEEVRRTVTSKLCLGQRDGPQSAVLSEFIRFADQPGSLGLACSYHAGVCFKQRLLGDYQLTGASNLGVLDTDELSFKYFKQAAEGGLGLAMQSLADNYKHGRGVRKDMRSCREWLWRATLINSAGTKKLIENNSVTVNEITGVFHSLKNIEKKFTSRTFPITGPNYGSLLVALHGNLAELDFKLPPFAAAIPTLQVGRPPSMGSFHPYLIGEGELRKVIAQMKKMTTKGIKCIPMYGRRGSCAQATALSLGEAARPLEAHRFIVPPAPSNTDIPEEFPFRLWELGASSTPFDVVCIHEEQGKTHGNTPLCAHCLSEGIERLSAVASGSVVLSCSEALNSRGQMAIYRRQDGTLTSETFKDYGRGEAEVVLAAALASPLGKLLAHPLFVAQDPNLLWPLIFSYGSVRAALEHVGPHVEWDNALGPVSPPLPARPLLPGLRPGDVLRRCGSDACLSLELERSKGAFLSCGRCRFRRYCGAGCQKLDWPVHKGECLAAASGLGAASVFGDARVAPYGGGAGDGTAAASGAAAAAAEVPPPSCPLEIGEEVVVHGLRSRPDLNHCVGVVDGEQSEAGRFVVRVGRESLAMRANNLHRLGVRVDMVPDGGGRVVRCACSVHGRELCDACSLDFSITNQLAAMQCASAAPLPRDTAERVAQTHFARVPREWVENGQGEWDTLDPPHRTVLVDVLAVARPTPRVAAAAAGLACFAARTSVSARPLAADRVRSLLGLTSVPPADASAAFSAPPAAVFAGKW